MANSESLSLQTEQAAWITRDLAANPARCIMATWHKPMFTSSAGVKPYPKVLPMWKALYNAGADVIIGGHSHQYERFAPTTPVGIVNNTRGIRHWVVGAGGGFLMKFSATPHPASLKRLSTFGVMKLDLWPDHYTWQFIGTAGQILDSGTAYCH